MLIIFKIYKYDIPNMYGPKLINVSGTAFFKEENYV